MAVTVPQSPSPARDFLLALYKEISLDVIDSSCQIETAALATMKNGRERNEDRAFIAKYHCKDESFVLAGVMDGVGGGLDGGVCCDMALTALLGSMMLCSKRGEDRMKEGLEWANSGVALRYSGNGGCTIVAVLVDQAGVTGVSAGDSFLYAGSLDGNIDLVSRVDNMEAIMRADGTSEEEIESIAPKFRHMITQYLGTPDGFDPNVFTIKPEQAQRIIAASDGVVSDLAVASHKERPDEFVKTVMSTGRPAGDNGTAVCVDNIIDMFSPLSKTDVPKLEVIFPYDSCVFTQMELMSAVE